MILYFDTSALVKYFHEETGTKTVTKLLDNPENEIYVSELVIIEFCSSLYRRFRNDEIDESQLNTAIHGFKKYLNNINIEPVRRTIVKEAEKLLSRFGKYHGLRTLDALQLGTFNLIAEKEWIFICADNKLCSIVEKEMSFKIINPILN